MLNKIKMKYLVILYFSLIISSAKTSAEIDGNEIRSASIYEENQCDLYTYKVVKPLLENFHEIQSKDKNHDALIESKDREMRDLQVRLAEIISENVQKNNIIELYEKFNESNAAQVDLFRENNRLLTKTAKYESDQLAELNFTVTAYSQTIKEQKSQILKFEAQNELDSAKLLNYEGQLANNAELIRTKDTIIADQKTELQMKAIILNETKVELEETKKAKLEEHADSCKPFAIYPGIHKIKVPGMDSFDVLCQSAGTEPGWIVIQQRINGREDFYRDWNTYKTGFGSFDGDFFLGLEKIHRLTRNRRFELYIQFEEFNGKIRYATYEDFAIAGEVDQYRLFSVFGFSGNVTGSEDSMQSQDGQRFYTFDRDNSYGCAKYYHGGWWYGYYAHSNLNGKYFNNRVYDRTSIYWYHDWYSLKKVQMLIRPKYD